MAQQRDPWLDLAAKRGLKPAVSAQDDDPWTAIAAKRGFTAEPVEPGGLDALGGMNKATDWTALATRIGAGLWGNMGGIKGAVTGAGGEALAQWQEGRFNPLGVASQAVIGAIPFGKWLGGALKPIMAGDGYIPAAVNAASNIGAGAAKGGAIGAGTVTADRLMSEQRLPSKAEFITSAALGTAGGGLASGLTRKVAQRFGDVPGEVSPAATSAQGGLPFDANVGSAAAPVSAPAAARPRILKGAEQYRQQNRVAPSRPAPWEQAPTREPFIRPMGEPPGPQFGNLTDDAQQMPLGGSQPASSRDLLAELLDLPPLPQSSFRLPAAPSGAASVTPSVRPSVTAGGASPGRVALMERMRETADMGRPNNTFVGEPEILAPMRPGEEAFSRPVGRSSTTPGADMTPDDMVAELLGLPPRPAPVQRMAPQTAPVAPTVRAPEPPAPTVEDILAGARSPSEFAVPIDHAPVRSLKDLSPEEIRELRSIAAEMEEFPFQRGFGRETFETATGGDRIDDVIPGYRAGLLPHVAGAPVFHDIMGGTKGSRQSVVDAIERFLDGGKSSAITQRTIDTVRRRLQGDTSVRKAMLPQEAGDTWRTRRELESERWAPERPPVVDPNAAPAEPSILDRLAELGAEPVGPKPKIPIEITRLWQGLKPKWQATVDAQANDGVPFAVDPTEDLLSFAKRIVGEPDPRRLFGAERKVAKELGDQGVLAQLRELLGSDSGGGRMPGEEGSISPELLYNLGATGAGAAAAPFLDKDSADPTVSMVGGGITGLLTSLAVRNPRLLERMRSSGLFSGAAIPKSFLGNVGGMAAYAAENPGTARVVAEETFSPETMTALRAGFNRPMAREATSMTADSPFSYPGRAIGAPDFATRDIIQRVEGRTRGGNLPGIPTGAQSAAGGDYTMSGDPKSELGRAAIEATTNPWVRLLAPVVRTPVNWLERGMERTPGVGLMRDVKAWTGTSPELVRRRQALGGLAMLTGAGAGAAAAGSPAGDIDVNPLSFGPQTLESALPFLSAAMGPYGMPLTLGVQGGKAAMRDKGSPLGALEAMAMETQDSLPLPTQYGGIRNMLRSFVPYSAAMRALSPVDPKELDTSSSFFGPMLGQVPYLNEALFPRKRKARPSAAKPPARRRP